MSSQRSFWLYLRLRILAFLIRLPIRISRWIIVRRRFGLLPCSDSIRPKWTTTIPSSKSSRKIKLLVHEPAAHRNTIPELLPVHLNFHGSGFVLPLHGTDAEFYAYIANTVPCIVIDCDYSKAPEHPFPAAVYDVLDAVAYVQSQPHRWDVNKLTVGGYSAGAALALAACISLPPGVIKAATLWYPPTDFTRRGYPDEKRMYRSFKRGQTPGVGLGKTVRTFFDQSYVLPNENLHDPRLSPFFAAPEAFPTLLLICGDSDPLCKEGEDLVKKINDAKGSAQFILIPGAGHGWERTLKRSDESFIKLRNHAFQEVTRSLQTATASRSDNLPLSNV